jgi:DNA polymerase III sliding clamp (beta) subunit (PCNA family)
LEIERAKLLKAVARVLPAVAKKELFEGASKIAFVDGCLVAYDDAVSIFEQLPGVEELSGAVDGRKLHELLSRTASDSVTISTDDGKLVVRCGRARATFDLSPVSLPLGEIDRSGAYQKLPDGFVTALKLVAGCCAHEMSRPVLTCVRLGGDRIEASDGYRLARVRFPGADLPPVLLPAAAVDVVADHAVETVGVGEGGEWLRFTSGGSQTEIFARLSAGAFPDLDAIYAVEGLSVELPDLREAIDRARVFAKREHSVDEQVDLTLKTNQIEVRATCDGGQFAETVRWKGDASAAFSIHPDFLSEALEHGTSCVLGKDKIKFSGANFEHVIALRG